MLMSITVASSLSQKTIAYFVRTFAQLYFGQSTQLRSRLPIGHQANIQVVATDVA